MACTKIIAIHHTLNKSLNYITDPSKTALTDAIDYVMNCDKTEQGLYISAMNCGNETAYEEMMHTQAVWGKTEAKILGYHIIQSFKPGEVTPETAHRIGCEFVSRCLAEKYEVVVTTHLNKRHLHNHILFNSVSFCDGRMYRNNYADYYRDIRGISDGLCKEYGLSVVENPEHGKSRHYSEWKADNDGCPTWRSSIREDVEQAIMVSMSFQAFIRSLKEKGYEVVAGGKYMKVRPPGKERFVRLRSLGNIYTEEAIRQRILQQRTPERLPKPALSTIKCMKVRGNFKLSRITWKGLRALYFHYLYMLRRAQRQPTGQAPFLLREDLRLMDAISEQAKFLNRHGIDSKEQLTNFRMDTERQINAATAERNALSDKKRRTSVSPERKVQLGAQISVLSTQLKPLRQDVKLCDAILERSVVIAAKQEQLKQQQQDNRKITTVDRTKPYR